MESVDEMNQLQKKRKKSQVVVPRTESKKKIKTKVKVEIKTEIKPPTPPKKEKINTKKTKKKK